MPLEILLILGGLASVVGVGGALRLRAGRRGRDAVKAVATKFGLTLDGAVARGEVRGSACRIETRSHGDDTWTSIGLAHEDFAGLRGGSPSLWQDQLPLGDPAFDRVFAFESFPAGLRSRLDATGRSLLIEAAAHDVRIEDGALTWTTRRVLDASTLEDRLGQLLEVAQHLRPDDVAGDLLTIALRDEDQPVALGAVEALLEVAPERAEAAVASRWPAVQLAAAVGVAAVDDVVRLSEDGALDLDLRLDALRWLSGQAPQRTDAVWSLLAQGVAGSACVEILAQVEPTPSAAQIRHLLDHPDPAARACGASLLTRVDQPAPSTREALHALLRDDDDSVVCAAAETLASWGAVADVPALNAAGERLFLNAATRRALAGVISRIQAAVDPDQAGGLALVAGGGELSLADDD